MKGWGPIHWRRPLRYVAAAVLGAWMAGLVVASVQLAAWNDELVRTLLQIRADAVFRTRMVEGREPIPRDWYRGKALALLAASEKLQDDTVWALFVPGSWNAFDDLRPRVAARIERAFGDIAVETVRRELYFKASQLTGVPQDSRTAELLAGRDCAPPPVSASLEAMATPGRGPQELPEYIAVQNHLAAIAQLDQAVQAMLALQSPASTDPANLRLLVRYTLGVELPGRLSRSAAFFRGGLKPEDITFAATGVPRLQWAARCSVAKAMKVLDTRLFERNDLIAAETHLAQRAGRLFAPGARPGSFADTVEGYREVIAALNEQEALLAHADYAWLHHAGGSSLGPAHERLLTHIGGIGVLGPEAAEQVRRQSGTAVQRFRRHFGMVFGAGSEPALVWREDRGRLMLSPQRVALRDGLAALLREPFMAPARDHDFPAAAQPPLSWDTGRLEQALALADAHQHFTADSLPGFPPTVRPAIARFVDGHLAQMVQDATVEAMRPAGAPAPGLSDPNAYRAEREQLARVQALLGEMGARGRAERLRALVMRDLVERLALAEEAMWRSSIFSDRTQHFGWWQREGSPILQAFGVADSLTLRYLLAQQLSRLDESGRVAAAYLPYVDSSIGSSPTVTRWHGIVDELKRYRAGAPDSSLHALERYLLSLGPELNRSNCVEKLQLATPAAGRTDEFAQRHRQIHNALMSRCVELRYPPRASEPARAVSPFG